MESDPLDHLVDKLFHTMGTDGVYARTALYEDVVERLTALITRHRETGTEVMRFPPVMNRAQLEKSGLLEGFPNLLGCVCGLHEEEALAAFKCEALSGRRPALMAGFPVDRLARDLKNTWHTAAKRIYGNWISYLSSQRARRAKLAAVGSLV